jgi:lipopolysaccharide/colanic/teichoic acid biosynthesis glycosyltransferase
MNFTSLGRSRPLKRWFDFFAALLGLTLLAPPLILIALAIWIEDRHSPFFRGQRVARGGGNFRMVKFRTMIPNAWKSGVNSTALGDRRITRVGSMLRKCKLDELPQLWNVLTGDMSLVGPRPQIPTDADLYTPEERKMLLIRPGITDLASIVFADEAEILSGSADADLLYNQIIRPWKSRLALLYTERRTLRIDLTILFLTLSSAVSRDRALQGVQAILKTWKADSLLLSMASRNTSLKPWPAPGASEIAGHYPRRAAQA